MSAIVVTELPLLPDSTFVIYHDNDSWISPTKSFVDIDRLLRDDVEDDVGDDRSVVRTVIEVFAVAVVSIGIIISNIINLAVLTSLGTSMPWTTRMFLINLSVSDLLVGVVACAPAVVPTYAGRWMYGDTWCQVSGVTHGTSVTISIWSISMVGLYRYAATALPMKYRKLVAARSKRCYAIVAAMWAAALITFAAPLFTKPDLVYYRYSQAQRMCGLHWEYPLYAGITGFYIPILSGAILIFTGYRISSTLSRRAAKALPLKPVVHTNNGQLDRSVHNVNDESSSRLPQSRRCLGRHRSPPSNPQNVDDDRPDEGDDMEMGELPPPSHAQTSGTNVASSTLLTVPDGASSVSRVPNSTALCSGAVPVTDTHLNDGTEPRTVPSDIGSKLRWASGSRRTLRILIYTGIAYFTCWGPYVTIVYVRCFAPSWRPPSALEFTLMWLANANSALNVFIYSSTNAAFRRHCVRLCRHLLPCSSRPSRKGAAGGSTRGAPSSAAGYSVAPVFEPTQHDNHPSGESVPAYVEIPVAALTPPSMSPNKTSAHVKMASNAVILGECESNHLQVAQTLSLRDRKFDQSGIGNNMFLTIPSVNVNRNAKWIDIKRRHV